jgi:hypothetical protein
VKEYAPDELVVVLAVAAPVSLTVAPLAPAPDTVPEIVKVCTAELKFAVTFAVVIVTF